MGAQSIAGDLSWQPAFRKSNDKDIRVALPPDCAFLRSPVSINGIKRQQRRSRLNAAGIWNGIIMGRHFISRNCWEIRRAAISTSQSPVVQVPCGLSAVHSTGVLAGFQLHVSRWGRRLICECIRLRVFRSLYSFISATYYGMTRNNVRRVISSILRRNQFSLKGSIHNEQRLTQTQEIIDGFHQNFDSLYI